MLRLAARARRSSKPFRDSPGRVASLSPKNMVRSCPGPDLAHIIRHDGTEAEGEQMLVARSDGDLSGNVGSIGENRQGAGLGQK